MSTESSKVVWITVAASAIALVLAIAGVFLFYPRNQAPSAPATPGNTAAPKPLDPQDYLNAPATAPTETKRNNGDVIVIYGDKPQTLPPLGSDGAASATSGAVDQGTGASTPAATLPAGDAAGSTTGSGDLAQSPAPQPAKSVVSSPSAAAPKAVATTKPAAKTTKPAATSTSTKASTQKPAAQAHYWIQAASFAEKGKADILRESLAAKGIAALITVKDINGKSWYRVRVGPYSSSKEASGWLGKVKLVRGCDEAFVTE